MIKLFSLILTLFLVSIASAAAEVELVFSSAVEVSPRSETTLYDLVEAKNLNEDTLGELKDIVLAESGTSTLKKSELAKMLRAINARFILPSELKIIRSRSAISRMEVERKIKNKIHSRCLNCDVQVQISSVPNKMDSDWEMDLNIDLTKNTVMIPVFATKKPDLKGWIVAEIKRYQSVPVLNKSVKIGEVLTADMLAVEKRQLNNQRDTLQKIDLIVGMLAARYLNAGQTLQVMDLKKEQVLKKGQMVRAVVGGSDFEVAISAEAQESGTIGDVVKIKNIDSQKVFAAKIVDRGIVRIE